MCFDTVVWMTATLSGFIGADTVLKLWGTNSGAKRRKFFLACPQICVVPPIPGAQWGHTTVETDMVKITRVLKKQGTVDLAT